MFGYELLNEPWAGDVVADLSLMLPGVAGRRNLAPAWERVGTKLEDAFDFVESCESIHVKTTKAHRDN